ncbi:hypothetical protein BYT27DRAFT_7256868 [Phlegmacium glaucopus]|nr:hypothetical protein BYT27DRAFT_7256868 [Phlegmacium glaucopus]
MSHTMLSIVFTIDMLLSIYHPFVPWLVIQQSDQSTIRIGHRLVWTSRSLPSVSRQEREATPNFLRFLQTLYYSVSSLETLRARADSADYDQGVPPIKSHLFKFGVDWWTSLAFPSENIGFCPHGTIVTVGDSTLTRVADLPISSPTLPFPFSFPSFLIPSLYFLLPFAIFNNKQQHIILWLVSRYLIRNSVFGGTTNKSLPHWN